MYNKKIEIEMLTAEDKVSKMKNISLIHDSIRNSKNPSLTFHACSDVTRWNQNWTSQKTSLSILSLELPHALESRLLSLASSFSVKFVTLNSKLIKKHKSMCENKSVIGKDLTSILEKTHKSTMSIQCQSAFFQGVLHYMSSYCAVIKNFASDQIMDLLMKEEGLEGMLLLSDTMLSSDDITKVSTFNVSSIAKVEKFAILLMTSLDVSGAIMDEVISRKKTSVHILLFEFNSIFTLLGKVQEALIKHVVSVCQTFDSTSPYLRLKEALSSLQEFFSKGATQDLIKFYVTTTSTTSPTVGGPSTTSNSVGPFREGDTTTSARSSHVR